MRRVLLLLAIVVALYLVTVGVGLSRGDGEGSDMESLTGGFVGALGGLTAWFAPELTLDGLACEGQPVSQIFRLTEQVDACTLAIPRDTEHDYRHAELAVVPAGTGPSPAVYIVTPPADDDSPAARPDPASCLPAPPRDPLWLEVRYAPNDEDTPDGSPCWLRHDPKKTVSITVLEAGGRLTLACMGCDADARRELVLRMR
jgi:hypothetical protein